MRVLGNIVSQAPEALPRIFTWQISTLTPVMGAKCESHHQYPTH